MIFAQPSAYFELVAGRSTFNYQRICQAFLLFDIWSKYGIFVYLHIAVHDYFRANYANTLRIVIILVRHGGDGLNMFGRFSKTSAHCRSLRLRQDWHAPIPMTLGFVSVNQANYEDLRKFSFYTSIRCSTHTMHMYTVIVPVFEVRHDFFCDPK